MFLTGGICAEALDVSCPDVLKKKNKHIASKYAFNQQETCRPVLYLLNSPELSAAYSFKQNINKVTLLLKQILRVFMQDMGMCKDRETRPTTQTYLL